MCVSAMAPFETLHYEKMDATLIGLFALSDMRFIKPKEQAITSMHKGWKFTVYLVYTLGQKINRWSRPVCKRGSNVIGFSIT